MKKGDECWFCYYEDLTPGGHGAVPKKGSFLGSWNNTCLKSVQTSQGVFRVFEVFETEEKAVLACEKANEIEMWHFDLEAEADEEPVFELVELTVGSEINFSHGLIVEVKYKKHGFLVLEVIADALEWGYKGGSEFLLDDAYLIAKKRVRMAE